jgi:Flp pilus assembly pilin Flp
MIDRINGLLILAREWQRGQTVTEYAMILSALAIVVFISYRTMGTEVSDSLGIIDGTL